MQRVAFEINISQEMPERSAASYSDWRASVVAATDVLDGICETILSLWLREGELQVGGIAEHRFISIEQLMLMDPRKFNEDFQYHSVIEVVYEDTVDDAS